MNTNRYPIEEGDTVEIKTRHWGTQVGRVIRVVRYPWCIGASIAVVRWPHPSLGHVDSQVGLIDGGIRRVAS
jgi:hypothetical protein